MRLVTRHSRLHGQVVVTDFRPLPAIPIGNRFLVFTIFPQASVAGAGACLLPPATADARIAEIVSTLERNG